jgi:hypothetical protein
VRFSCINSKKISIFATCIDNKKTTNMGFSIYAWITIVTLIVTFGITIVIIIYL